jgi:uncharacterized membrane protein
VEHLEALMTHGVLALNLAVELVGVAVIGVGSVVALIQLVRIWRQRGPSTFTTVRLTLAHYLALALEFQLAADILVTALAPSWEEIGKLAAIATIRTALNFFLAREVKEERAEDRAERSKLSEHGDGHLEVVEACASRGATNRVTTAQT